MSKSLLKETYIDLEWFKELLKPALNTDFDIVILDFDWDKKAVRLVTVDHQQNKQNAHHPHDVESAVAGFLASSPSEVQKVGLLKNVAEHLDLGGYFHPPFGPDVLM